MTMATDLTVANTILAQLGGARFTVMTGAYSYVGGANELSMRLPRNPGKVFGVRIQLDANDTYTVVALASKGSVRAGTLQVFEKMRVSCIYCDQLRSVFEDATGLYTSL
jgi:hypothetical protein